MLARLHVLATEISHVRGGVERAPIGRIHLHMEPVSPVRHSSVVVENALIVSTVAGYPPASVVLQPAVHPVGIAHVHADRVVLADGHVVECQERLPTVDRQIGTLIGRHIEGPLVVRIDP